jgi:hypothetical protein
LDELNGALNFFDCQCFFVIFFRRRRRIGFSGAFFSNLILAARQTVPMENSEDMGIAGLWELWE